MLIWGTFGKFPIRLAWFTVVPASLTLNYFGQGALLLKNPEAIKNPFFLLGTGLGADPTADHRRTGDGNRLAGGYLWRLLIDASGGSSGIFVADAHYSHLRNGVRANLYSVCELDALCRGRDCDCRAEHSSNLAAAYGIAVTGTMVLTSILSTTVARQNWRWNKYFVALILIAFLCVDIPLFTANLDKLLSGGWLPLSLGTVMFIVMTTWKSERFRLLRRMHEHGNSLEAMIASLEKSPPVRVPGTAVYMSRAINVIPFALMHNLKHNKVFVQQGDSVNSAHRRRAICP